MLRRRRWRGRVLSMVPGSVLLACGGGDAGPSSVHTDSAGVEIVQYAGVDHPAPFTLREEFRLGGSEAIPEQSFYEVSVGSVGTDAAGNLYVLDRAGSRVVVFDGSGTFLRSMGRAGGGPGELGFPGGLLVEADGTVNVMDFGKRAMVRFDPAGEPLDIVPLPPGYSGGVIRPVGDALVLPLRRAVRQQGTFALTRVADADTSMLGMVEPAETRPIQLASCGMGFRGLPPVFHPTLRWDAAGERVAFTTMAEYDVVVHIDGRDTRRVRRAIAPTPATEALALEELGPAMEVRTEGGVRRCDARELLEQQGIAPTVPAIDGIALSPEGWLWVQRGGTRVADKPIDVFDAAGDYVGTLPAGSPFPILFLPHGRIAAGETDDLDVTRLVVYTVARPVLGEGTR